jgi:hypothetical protein
MTTRMKMPATVAAGPQRLDVVNLDRRRLLVTAAMGLAATATASLFPARPAQAAERGAIRPFRIDGVRVTTGGRSRPG